jgi:DNA-binding transcriptional ArsR family regulator
MNTGEDRPSHAPRGGLTREQLEPLVAAGATLKEIAEAVDRSQSTVQHWMRKLGLQLQGARRNLPTFREAEARGLGTVKAHCRTHGHTEFVRRPDGGWRCRSCRSKQVSDARRRSKLRLVEWAGGRCVLCGYDRCVAALEFHHLDPEAKRFPISRMGRTCSFDKLVEEARKCVLLCSNCHAEVEAGFASLDS